MPVISAVIFLMMLGSAWPVFFYEGSALGKNLERKQWIESTDDAAVVAAMEAQLYGEEPVETESHAHDTSRTIDLLRLTDRTSAALCLVLAAVLPFAIRRYPASAWLYLLPALWILLNALGATLNGGKAHAELSIPAHATRWMLPIVFALLVWRPASTRTTANWLLRLACAMTFAVHGWEALRLNPVFQDLIFSFGALLGIKISSGVCHGLLYAIGTMDMLLTVGVLLFHIPMALRWMAIWGLITAFARPLTISWLVWPEFAIRLANGACPWLILLIGLPALIHCRKGAEPFSKQEPVSPNA